MKQILLMIAVVALVGCGKKTTPSEPETNAEPKVAAEKQEPPKVDQALEASQQAGGKDSHQRFCQHAGDALRAGAGDGRSVLHMGNAGEGLRGVRGGECGGGCELEEVRDLRRRTRIRW